MPGTAISGLSAITSVQTDDLLVIVDVHDTSMAPAGTDKKITLSQVTGAPAPVTTISSASGTVNLDPVAQVLNVTMTADCTFTFTPSSSLINGDSYMFSVYLNQDSTGGWTVTWPASVLWLGTGTPTLPSTANSVSLLVFETTDAGTIWYGSAVQQLPSLPLSVVNGGTGQASAAAAYNALSPMTLTGDIEYESASSTAARLAGNITTTKKFLTQTCSGSASAAPAWGTVAAGDIAAVSVLTFVGSGTTVVNAALGNVFTLTLTASTTTLGSPSNPADGQAVSFRITQGTGGSFTLAYGDAYNFGTARRSHAQHVSR